MEETLVASHQEEIADAEKYAKLASEAPEKYAPILRQIAAEEHVHARHLEDILSDMKESKSE